MRRVTAFAQDICQNRPLDALTFADAAITIAEALPDNVYPFNAVYELRGTAWKERANALLVKGDYPEALLSIAYAERAFRRLSASGFGLSTVALVRASVLYEQGLFEEAAESAEIAEAGFAHLGQDERRTRAVFLRGSIKFETREFAIAQNLFARVLDYGESTNDVRWIARASYASANCALDTGEMAEASMRFHRALIIFREIGPEWDRLATEWGLARILLHGGNLREAVRRLTDIATGYEDHAMLTNAALVRLDVVEALLALGESKAITELATRLFRTFKAAGMIRSALTAIAYMKEAAADGKLTPASVDAVRTFLRRSVRQPDLVFAPPPASLG